MLKVFIYHIYLITQIFFVLSCFNIYLASRLFFIFSISAIQRRIRSFIHWLRPQLFVAFFSTQLYVNMTDVDRPVLTYKILGEDFLFVDQRFQLQKLGFSAGPKVKNFFHPDQLHNEKNYQTKS